MSAKGLLRLAINLGLREEIQLSHLFSQWPWANFFSLVQFFIALCCNRLAKKNVTFKESSLLDVWGRSSLGRNAELPKERRKEETASSLGKGKGRGGWGRVLILFCFVCCCFSKVGSTPKVGLELITLRSRVRCSADWGSQVPLDSHFEQRDDSPWRQQKAHPLSDLVAGTQNKKQTRRLI